MGRGPQVQPSRMEWRSTAKRGWTSGTALSWSAQKDFVIHIFWVTHGKRPRHVSSGKVNPT
jgi:hypothetical protein